jgi:anti-sigma factor RsiW
MTCPWRTELGAFALDALDADDAAVLAAHLPHCSACWQELGELSALVELLVGVRDLGEVPQATQDDGLARLLLTARQERRGPRAVLFRVLPATVAAAAAAVLLAAGLALGPSVQGHGSSGVWSDPDSITVHAASGPVAGVAHVTRSPSGSAVELAVRGLPTRSRCRLLASTHDGAEVVVEPWEDYSRAATMRGTTRIGWRDLDRLVLQAADGRALLVVPVPR